MHIAEINTLYEYNYWANRLLLDQAEHLSPEQMFAPTAFSWGSLGGTLIHILWAEWLWRTRMQNGTSPTERFGPDDFPTMASLMLRWETEEQQMRAFLATLRDDDLNRPISYTNTRGTPYTTLLWHMLLHLVNHGTQHRSESAAMLTDVGRSPGDIDFILFLRRQQTSG